MNKNMDLAFSTMNPNSNNLSSYNILNITIIMPHKDFLHIGIPSFYTFDGFHNPLLYSLNHSLGSTTVLLNASWDQIAPFQNKYLLFT